MKPKQKTSKLIKPMQSKKKIAEVFQVQLTPGTVISIKEGGKYLVILPKDADIKRIAPAIAKFFEPVPVFILAVNDVTDIKIAELLNEK